MDDTERAVLAALAELEHDEEAADEATAEGLASRAGIPFAEAAVALERMARQGFVMHRARGWFTSGAPEPAAEPPRYALTARGRGRLEEA